MTPHRPIRSGDIRELAQGRVVFLRACAACVLCQAEVLMGFGPPLPISWRLSLTPFPVGHQTGQRRLLLVLVVGAAILVAAVAPMPGWSAADDEWAFPSDRKPDHGFPPAADGSREHVLRFRDAPTWFKLRVAPAAGGVTCFILHWPDGSGMDMCPRDAATRRASSPTLFRWRQTVLFFGTVATNVRYVDLPLEDGFHTTSIQREGFIAYAIPRNRWASGRQPETATLRATDGRIVRRMTLDWSRSIRPS